MDTLLFISIGVLLGAAVAVVLAMLWKRTHDATTQRLPRESREQTEQRFAGTITELKNAFSALSRDA